ncbi:MAG: 1-deoxy-D-xylulose-5-phosphate reductoisomerase [Spirochaetales bacterium]|uniref:1-deoxy-D-xylulose 5-phosphate reductoisomerase n=1 Tax=Candidatus Thalassospirochaeta sargassi TaxID=3119039 RepID=A0AAJ1MJ90_9SPIO|nr:1-deoxy-D-xylulose-5-phosphate reductoisomerase [Spirochaetales bacterium]
MKRKKLIILGCTGSIGRNTATVLKANKEFFEVAGISAHTDESSLMKFSETFGVKNICLSGRTPSYPGINYTGEDGLIEMIRETEADLVLNGIAGSAGLASSIACLEAGMDLACANKETIVMAGELILELANANNAKIIPVDSEHSAIWQLMRGFNKDYIAELILTASGGAFRNRSIQSLENVTVNAALAHPTWEMGPKITIDSATMANKGLEIIEAHFLFGIPAEKIKIVIHPKSYVHSFIRTIDGYLYSQISLPDMSIPIQNALSWPDIIPANFAALDLPGVALEFQKLDKLKYPIVKSAYSALEQKGAYPLAFNAANEVAVASFIEESIGFTDIAALVEDVMQMNWPGTIESFEHIFTIDSEVRAKTIKMIEKIR